MDIGNLFGFDTLVDPSAGISFKNFLRAVLKARNGEFVGDNFMK